MAERTGIFNRVSRADGPEATWTTWLQGNGPAVAVSGNSRKRNSRNGGPEAGACVVRGGSSEQRRDLEEVSLAPDPVPSAWGLGPT